MNNTIKALPHRPASRTLMAALLAFSLAGCDFIKPTTADPNAVGTATVDQLFTGTQVNLFYLSQSIYARLASMWTQQTAGVTSQFTGLDQYTINEDDFDDEMSSHYYGGGLIDLRKGATIAEDAGRRVYAGILKVHEAWYIGTAADLYGDVPYSEAVDPEIAQPKLDPQLEVYAAVQAKLDQALADLGSGAGAGPGAVDLNFQGSVACWTQAANSLKARFYLHTAEVNPGAYALALTAAQKGIDSNTCNWRAIHSPAATETNVWHQFMRDRPGHIVGGFYLINLMNGGTPASTTDDDPRLPIYFTRATATSVANQFLGSRPGSPPGDAWMRVPRR
jgi:starch-binding outer membrane protein, SusD/RagB family